MFVIRWLSISQHTFDRNQPRFLSDPCHRVNATIKPIFGTVSKTKDRHIIKNFDAMRIKNTLHVILCRIDKETLKFLSQTHVHLLRTCSMNILSATPPGVGRQK